MTRSAALVLTLGLAACGNGDRYVVINVDNVAASANTLQVTTTLAGVDSVPIVFSLSGESSTSFSLAFDERKTGWLALGIGAVDSGHDCTLAWHADGFELDSDTPSTLDVMLDTIAPPTCSVSRTPGMVYVPGGTYIAGCSTDTDGSCFADEMPPQNVQLAGFEIDRTEVTIGAYYDCVAANQCPLPNGDKGGNATFPRTSAVNWVDFAAATAYCAWRHLELPSEVQWEAAARGPSGSTYPWGEAPPTCSLANFDPGTFCRPVDENDLRVAALASGTSWIGTLDQAGNAYEWVADWYQSRATLADYTMPPATGTERVLKSGSALSTASTLRGASRFDQAPDGSVTTPNVTIAENLTDVGFRCARPLAP